MKQIAGWYRGWTMVGLGVIMVMLNVGTVIYSFSIYVAPVSKELGLSRETFNFGMVFLHLGSALLTPFVGRMLDRFKVSTIVACGGVSMGAALVGLSIGDALWPKALILVLPLSFGFGAAGSIASYVLVARWFKIHRGRAMTIVALGQSAGTILFAPVVSAVIATIGWRQSLMCQGVFVGAALLLIAWAIVDHPRDDEHEPHKKAAPLVSGNQQTRETVGKPLAVREILSNPIFWMMATIFALTLAVVQATIASLVPLATGRGIPLVQASTLLSFLGVSGVAGKFVLAVIADRIERSTLIIFAIIVLMLFTLSLTIDLGYLGLVISCLLAGMAFGGFFPIYSALLADQFGAHSLGSTEGLVGPVISITSAVAIYVAGVTFDASGDYRLTFLIFSGVLVIALILAVGLRLMRRSRQRLAAA